MAEQISTGVEKSIKKAFDIHQYPTEVMRYEVPFDKGLNQYQIESRVEEQLTNCQEDHLTPSVSQIIKQNTITLFNFINLVLAIAVLAVGEPTNLFFMGVVLCNTLMGIWQELRSKKTLDKLAVLAEVKVAVVRDGQVWEVDQGDVVLDDILYLNAGDQVCADTQVLSAKGLEADESLLTGETDRVRKSFGDLVVSGSYITAGSAYVRAIAVGKDNYANALSAQAKKKKEAKSKLLYVLNNIIRGITFLIVPMGALLLWSYIREGDSIRDAVLGTTAALIGMIPNGLVLLTSVTLTVGAMALAKKKALVQSLPSIETLARVDVICLDKTGTITDGTLSFEYAKGYDLSQEEVRKIISNLMGTLQDTNSTAKALLKWSGKTVSWQSTGGVSFSSDRKWSGASYEGIGSYYLGAPNFIFGDEDAAIRAEANELAAQGLRVLALSHSQAAVISEQLSPDRKGIALIIMTDHIRDNARSTFEYFLNEGVDLKVISGDNPVTVSHIARDAGIPKRDQIVDMHLVEDVTDYRALVRNNGIFGHVRPEQKQKLIQALQDEGHTTCMTGDGVNDILAMRQSDCSVAMVSGSPAARSACDFVLMTSDFGVMTSVLAEGRRVINNIEKVSCLYLVNTMYSVLLSIIYSILPYAYPFEPNQMTPVNALAVGIPSFVLALQKNYKRPENKLLINIFEHATPAALTIVFSTLYIQVASAAFYIPFTEYSSMIVFLIAAVGVYLLNKIARPLNKINKILLGGVIAGMVINFVFLRDILYLGLFGRNVFFYAPLIYFCYQIHDKLGKANHRFVRWLYTKKTKTKDAEVIE